MSVLTASAQTVERSLEEWMAVQGTFCIPDGAGGCLRLQGPQPMIVGIEDTASTKCAFIDYASVIDRWLTTESAGPVALPTNVTGSVKEHISADGTAEITVRLVTTNALMFVVDGCVGGELGSILFGWPPAEVLAGATPTLADVTFYARYIMPEAGLPLSDIGQIIAFPHSGEQIGQVRQDGDARGELRAAFGVPDGTAGTLSTWQHFNFEKANGRPIIKQRIDLDVESSGAAAKRDVLPAEALVCRARRSFSGSVGTKRCCSRAGRFMFSGNYD
jgi:hypothetical protein